MESWTPWGGHQKVCVIGSQWGNFSQGCEDLGREMTPYSYLLHLEAASRQNAGKASAGQAGGASFS